MARKAKRKTTARRGGKSGSNPSIGWFGAGVVIGLVLALFLYMQGFLPERPVHRKEAGGADSSGQSSLLEDSEEVLPETPESRFDFFTVLPEMEVLVPEQELSSQARPEPDRAEVGSAERFVLQAGSFRNPDDADQMKARIALLGSVASIQEVRVDNKTWHRVRIGPVDGARKADELRRQLQDNGIEVLVLRISS